MDKENTLYIDLKDGRVEIEMRPDLAPLHVAQIKALTRRGWHVVMACRDVNKAARAAESLGLSADQVSPMQIDLGSLASVRSFVVAVTQQKITFDALVCNAAIYLPRLQKPQRSPEGFEISVATNYLGHCREMHRRYHDSTGIVFDTLYPGCVADTALFRETPKAFQKIFPWFQKNITKGYVSQNLAGEWVAQAVADPGFETSGVHWSWGNRQKAGREAFSQPLSN
jgi:hypothetical protein